MTDGSESKPRGLVPSSGQALVHRGLRELSVAAEVLSRRGTWNARRVFSDTREALTISSAGQIATHAVDRSAIEIFGVDTGPSTVIPVTGKALTWHPGCFVWRPNCEHLIVALSGSNGDDRAQIHLVDVQQRAITHSVPGGFGLGAWSPQGTWFATSPDVNLWTVEGKRLQPISAFQFESSTEYLLGCRSLAFSPDEHLLFVVAEVGVKATNVFAHWDELFMFEVPALRLLRRVGPPDTVLSLSWTHKQQEVLMTCTYGKSFVVNTEDASVKELPFTAGVCCCHPSDSQLCAFADRKTVFLADVARGMKIAEHPIDDDRDEIESLTISWSQDGQRLFSASGLGQSYTYRL